MNYTRNHMEAACCLWEAMIELRGKGVVGLDIAFGQHGTVALRNVAIDLAPVVDARWNGFTIDQQEDCGAFDWEFCSKIVGEIDWAQWPPTLSEDRK